MSRDPLRLAFFVVVFAAASGCSAIVDSTLSSKHGDAGPGTDLGTDAGTVDSGPHDLGSDMPDAGPPCVPSCGMHATCDTAMHMCACDTGYTMGTGADCVDINECAAGTATCAMNAVCDNTPGSFTCHCRPGATGDGMTCTRPSILILTDTTGQTVIENAAMRAGTTFSSTNDITAFQTMLAAGGWDAVVVSSDSGPTLDTTTADAIATYVTGGGKLLIGYWDLTSFPSLLSALSVSATALITPSDVNTDTTTTPDLFAQEATFPSPLHFTNTVGTDGQHLTAFSGITAATFATGGSGAIAITNGGKCIVNGFLTSEAIASTMNDADGDGLLDISELIQNELNYLLRPHVLLYYDDFAAAPASIGAVARLGWTGLVVRDSTDFDRVYDRGGFDLMLIDSGDNEVVASNQTRISAWSATIGRTVLSYWDLDGSGTDTTVLRAAMHVSTVTIDNPHPVFTDPTSPIDFFAYVQTFPSPLTTMMDYGDNGDELTVTDTGFIAGRFDSATGMGAIAVTGSGHTIVDGFLSGDVGTTDNDGDGIQDMQELFQNELLYVMTRP